jgi:hypothetical protein
MEWQVITVAQSKEIENVGIKEPASFIWLKTDQEKYGLVQNGGFNDFIHHNAYNLSEIAIMLGYTFVKSNIKEAADQLIQEIKVGSCTAKDCNERLREAKSQSF